jgi:hypothetical protein
VVNELGRPNQHQITDDPSAKMHLSPMARSFWKANNEGWTICSFVMSLNDPDPSNWMEISGYEINGESLRGTLVP